MIKAIVKEGTTHLTVSGSEAEIFAETAIIVKAVCNSLKRKDEEAGERFRKTFTKTVSDGTIWLEGEELQKATVEKLHQVLSKPGISERLLDALEKALGGTGEGDDE